MTAGPALADDLRAVPAVGVVCLRGQEVLLVRRGNPPKRGEWSIPGGRIEPGETARQAALRELHEETGVAAELVGLVDVVDAIFHNRAGDLVTRHYVLIDFVAHWTGGEPVAGDDADEARFVPVSALDEFALWDETKRIIAAGMAIAQGRDEA